MANGIEVNNRTLRGLSRLTVTRLSDGLVYSLPTPQNVTIAEGVEQRQQTGKNEVGETVRLFSFTTSRQPTGVITFSHMQPEIIAMKNGTKLEEKNFSVSAPIQLWVTKGEFGGASSGQFGYGVAEDVNIGLATAPKASTTRGEKTVMLTQRAWADYSTWRSAETLSFAVGTNRALRFSDDIVTSQDVVSILVPTSGLMTYISDQSVGGLSIQGLVVDSLDRVHVLEIYQATVDLANAGLDMGAETMELNLFLNNPPGLCRAWNLLSPKTNNAVACVGE